MPPLEQSGERRPGRSHRRRRRSEPVPPPQALHDYCSNLAHVPQPTLQPIQSNPATNLFEHARPLPLASETTFEREGVTQPALPFTWYVGENDDQARTKPLQPLHQLQERVAQRGVITLSNAELLSLVLRTEAGTEEGVRQVHSLLTSYSVQELLQIEFGELSQRYHLGAAKAAQLQAMLEMARRLTLPVEREKHTIRSPYDAAALVRPEMEYLDHEEMRVLVLDTKNNVVANVLLYQGTVNSSVLRAGEIFRFALTRKCPSILI